MPSNQRLTGILLLLFVIVGGIAVYNHYLQSYYTLDSAKAFLSRAESAPTPDQMADAIQRSRELIPKSGNPVWWFPTTRTEFVLIHRDLDGLIELARLLGTLPREQEAYQVGMDTIRGKIRTLGEQLGEAAGYYFLSPLSMVLGALWLLGVAAVLYLRSKQHIRVKEEEPLLTT